MSKLAKITKHYFIFGKKLPKVPESVLLLRKGECEPQYFTIKTFAKNSDLSAISIQNILKMLSVLVLDILFKILIKTEYSIIINFPKDPFSD